MSIEGIFNDTMIILWALNMRIMSCSRIKPEERVSSEKGDLMTFHLSFYSLQ
ncbi:MAG: hypothetical protein QW260_07490 [Thermoproteota archaeon]